MALVGAEQPAAAMRSPARWGDLRKRIGSAVIMLPVALVCVWIGGVAFAALIALIAIGLAYEWLRLCHQPLGPSPVLMFASLPLAVFLTSVGAAASALALLLVITVVAAIKLRAFHPDRPLPFGVLYIGLGAVALVWLRMLPLDGRDNVFVLLLVIWATDIGAYAAGRAIGGPRLAPRISPGKTWSGAVGGLLAGMLVGFAAANFIGAPDAAWPLALVAGGISCVGQAGDLFESLLKRHFDVKDSGNLIPGHGGLLDRLDAVLAAAPAAALLALILGRGVMPWQ